MIKFSVKQKEFQNALSVATRAVSQRTTMPILECVLLEANGNKVMVTGNDMSKGIETSVFADIEGGGTIAVNAKMLLEIVKRLPDNDISFEADENCVITIKSGRSKFQLSGQTGEEFPRLDDIKHDYSFTIPESVLRDMINRTIFAVTTNESNKVMTGELFEVENDSLRVVALDGHRVAIRKAALGNIYEPFSMIVPGETLREISRILVDDSDSIVSVHCSMNHIVFEFGEVRAVSRLVDGQFYDVDKLFTNNATAKVTLSNAELQRCMERSLLFIREGTKTPIIMNIEDGEMMLSIKSPTGSFNESLEIEKEGSDMEIGFNPKFVLDALTATGDETITIYLNNGKAPAYIKSDDDSYNYVILPVNYTR